MELSRNCIRCLVSTSTPVVKGRRNESGQAAILGLMITLVVALLIVGLIDVYHVLEVRNWAYQAAQKASADGVTLGVEAILGVRTAGSDVSPCVGRITLDRAVAEYEAALTMNEYLNDRTGDIDPGDILYVYSRNSPGDYVVFPDNPTRGYPDNPARDRLLALANERWTVQEPSMAVAGVIPVRLFLGSLVGLNTINVTYFSATSVHQLDNVCP